MSAITLDQCLAAVHDERCPPEARRCVKALRSAAREAIPALSDKRALRDVHATLLEDQQRGIGQLIVDVLRTGPKGLPAFVALVTAKPARRRSSELDLYGDCYLVFGEWVTLWNRRQIRKVA